MRGVEKPIALEKAIERVKAAGLIVSSQRNDIVPKAPGAPAPSGQVDLLCTADVSGQRLTALIHIDLGSRTVNGLAANVMSDEITWATGAQNPATGNPALVRHTLNRLNGDYRSYQDGALYAAPPPTYRCSKAPAAQF